jgi:predicted PurR-regulated permease PerM
MGFWGFGVLGFWGFGVLGVVMLVLIQQLENHIIVPKVMQKAVGLNPLVSIVALLVGARLFGIVGALLSIPVTTAVGVVLTELYRSHMQKDGLIE